MALSKHPRAGPASSALDQSDGDTCTRSQTLLSDSVVGEVLWPNHIVHLSEQIAWICNGGGPRSGECVFTELFRREADRGSRSMASFDFRDRGCCRDCSHSARNQYR